LLPFVNNECSGSVATLPATVRFRPSDVPGRDDGRIEFRGDDPGDDISRRHDSDGDPPAIRAFGYDQLFDFEAAHQPACGDDGRIAIDANTSTLRALACLQGSVDRLLLAERVD